MSAIATPMIHTVNASVNPSEMVNIEMCKAVSIATAEPPTGVNQRAKYQIVFHVGEVGSGTPNTIKWSYADEATRDADYLLVLAAASTAI